MKSLTASLVSGLWFDELLFSFTYLHVIGETTMEDLGVAVLEMSLSISCAV